MRRRRRRRRCVDACEMIDSLTEGTGMQGTLRVREQRMVGVRRRRERWGQRQK
jgi:hypothetical protein